MSPFGDGARDAHGRFLPGNPGGPGNPHGGRTARLRAALLDQVSEDDIRDIALALVVRAKGGDMRATSELLNRLLGRPAASQAEDQTPEDERCQMVFALPKECVEQARQILELEAKFEHIKVSITDG